uniref:Uncharacterized protein n=1 Tax=Chenopodium quinoa TaxID=63459 RepID=A0A803KZT9_CHEQI
MYLMGVERNGVEEVPRKRKIQKILALLLLATLVSMIGGVVLVYWVIKYHPKNRELWMVPFGLVLFTTPPLVWFISIAADFCCPKEEQLADLELSHQFAVGSLSQPVQDMERR